MQTKTLAGTLAAVALTFGTAGAFVIVADQAQSSPAVYQTTDAQARCIGSAIDQVMTNEPEYPQDIVPRVAARCGVQVVVSRDADGGLNARPTGPALAGLTPLEVTR